MTERFGNSRFRSAHFGFTLVELLVVISLIALLIALLLPSIKKARQQTRYLICATQQRQIVQGLLCYATSNKNGFPFGYWASPTIIGGAKEVLECVQSYTLSSGEPGTDHDGPPVAVALRLLTCPDFLTRPDSGTSIYDPYDRVVMGFPQRYSSGGFWYPGWGPGDPRSSEFNESDLPSAPGNSAVHTTYMYLGGIGRTRNDTNGSNRWHGWLAGSQAMYDSYADIYGGIGPLVRMDDRMRQSEAALLTDRMWLTDPANPLHPFRRTGVGGHEAVPNHKRGPFDTIGGNVAFGDGHVEFRWVEQIKDRMDVGTVLEPYICY